MKNLTLKQEEFLGRLLADVRSIKRVDVRSLRDWPSFGEFRLTKWEYNSLEVLTIERCQSLILIMNRNRFKVHLVFRGTLKRDEFEFRIVKKDMTSTRSGTLLTVNSK